MNPHDHTPGNNDVPIKTLINYIATAGLILAICAGLSAVISGPGIRWAWWHFTTGFHHPAVVRRRRSSRGRHYLNDRRYPVRTANSSEYGGPKTAQQQRAAYPDIKPLLLQVTAATAFARALGTARDMGWMIVDENVQDGRIEAMDRTFLFGFTDDIVLRITPLPGGSKIDVRSASREGLSDIGTNAKGSGLTCADFRRPACRKRRPGIVCHTAPEIRAITDGRMVLISSNLSSELLYY
jgi:uncharacterized protein (DUF1499 family)